MIAQLAGAAALIVFSSGDAVFALRRRAVRARQQQLNDQIEARRVYEELKRDELRRSDQEQRRIRLGQHARLSDTEIAHLLAVLVAKEPARVICVSQAERQALERMKLTVAEDTRSGDYIIGITGDTPAPRIGGAIWQRE